MVHLTVGTESDSPPTGAWVLDARGLLCPLPVIRTQDRVASLDPGDRLRVRCTDPGTESDIPTWCRINGHRVVGIERDEDEIAIVLEVGGGDA